MVKLILLGFFLISPLVYFNSNDFILVNECKSLNQYKLSTGEYIVVDCPLNDEIRWVVGWNPENFVGLIKNTSLITSFNYKAKDTDGYIIDCRNYVDPATGERIMVCVYGEEDGDWGFHFFRLKQINIELIGEISLTEYSTEQDDYSLAPEDKISLKKGINGLEIDFKRSKYQLWDQIKKEWVVRETELHYRETGGIIKLLD